MPTTIISNGSKWAGQEPDTIPQLLDVLREWQLCPHMVPNISAPTVDHDRSWRFFGNFKRLSHVFNIRTDDPETIELLRTAIEANASIKYDPVGRFYHATVKDAGEMSGRWENGHDGTWHRIVEGRKGTERDGRTMTTDDLQALANAGYVSVW